MLLSAKMKRRTRGFPKFITGFFLDTGPGRGIVSIQLISVFLNGYEMIMNGYLEMDGTWREASRVSGAEGSVGHTLFMQNKPNFDVFWGKNGGRAGKQSQTNPI